MRRNKTKEDALPITGQKYTKQKTLLNGRLYKTLTISLGSPLMEAKTGFNNSNTKSLH